MARINNRGKYSNDDNFSENDFLIGSDGDNASITKTFSLIDLSNYIQEKIFENKSLLDEDTNLTDGDLLLGTDVDDNNITKNYSLEKIAIYVSEYLFDNNVFDPVIQNNLIRTIDLVPEAVGNNNIWEVVNNRAVFTVGQDEIFIFRSPYLTNGVQTNGYFILKSGARNYGLGQTATTTNDFFLLRLENEVVKTSQLVNDGANGVNPYINATDLPTNTSELINDGANGVNPYINATDLPTNTSDLINDGANGVNPYINATDLPVNTSELNNDGEDGISPFVSQGASTDLLINTGENGTSPYATILKVADSKIYIKNDDLIIPNQGHWINNLDFVGALNSFLRVGYKNQKTTILGFFGSNSTLIDIGNASALTYPILLIMDVNLPTSYIRFSSLNMTNSAGLTTFNFSYSEPFTDFQDYFDIQLTITGNTVASSTILYPILLSYNDNGISVAIRETSAVTQDIRRILIKVINPFNDIVDVKEPLFINQNLALGGTFNLNPTNGFDVLDYLEIVITGGTTPGTYKII